MTTVFKFSVATAEGHGDKWVARMFSAPKVEGKPFGVFGIKTELLGVFSSETKAKAAVEAKKSVLMASAKAKGE